MAEGRGTLPFFVNCCTSFSGVIHECSGANSWDVPVLNEFTGKCWSVFDEIVSSVSSDDIRVLCLASQRELLEAHIAKLKKKKKKSFGHVRFTLIEVAPSKVGSLCQLIRAAESACGPVMTKGFIWMNGWCQVPKDWESFMAGHKSTVKKDSTAVVTLYPYQTRPFSAMSTPGHRALVVFDEKTGEVFGLSSVSSYTCNNFDIKDHFPSKGRMNTMGAESMCMRSDLELNEVMIFSPEILRVLHENFDLQTFSDLVALALARSDKMESIYIYTKALPPFPKGTFKAPTFKDSPAVAVETPKETGQETPLSKAASGSVAPTKPYWGWSMATPKRLYETLIVDTAKDSQKIDSEGVRSYWKHDLVRGSVCHESFLTAAGWSEQTECCLLMEGARVDFADATRLTQCVCDVGSQVEAGCDLERVYVGANVVVPKNTKVQGPAFLLQENDDQTRLCLEVGTVFPQSPTLTLVKGDSETERDGKTAKYTVYRPEHDVGENMWLDYFPNRMWAEKCVQLANDPSRDPDAFLDMLYANMELEEGSAGEGEGEEEEAVGRKGDSDFEQEVIEILESVIGNDEHMKNVCLELRSLRLAEFKSDADVVRAVLRRILDDCSKQYESGRQIEAYTHKTGFHHVLSNFINEEDEAVHTIVYDLVSSYVAPDSGNKWAGNWTVFVDVVHALNDYLDNETYLQSYADAHSNLKTPRMTAFLTWLQQDDSDEDDDDSEGDDE